MKVTLGFSPCPNDTFIFDALVNKKIDTGGFDFEVVLADVQTLNEWALEDKLDVTKLSFPAFFQASDNYILLDSGSALGKGVGPLLISKQSGSDDPFAVTNAKVALPGINTTANLLFDFAYPGAANKTHMVFSAIEDAVINGEADYGVIIHENRFTYADKGLHKIKDLGTYWEEKMNCPIPLGGIAINQSIKRQQALQIDQLIRQSLEYAFRNYPELPSYVREHSQEMEEQVMRQHIDLYVNNYSLSLGEDGKHAIRTLFNVFKRAGNQVPEGISDEDLFL